jgi:hypothetical protein
MNEAIVFLEVAITGLEFVLGILSNRLGCRPSVRVQDEAIHSR